MAYTVHNFEQGDVLYAEQLNEMDAQIAANEESIANGISSDMLAENYSANKTYSIGDYVIYDNELYICVYEITAPEGWNSTHWEIANLGDGISNLNHQLSELEDTVSTTQIINTASGAIASFSDGADSMPIRKLVANIEPVQALHGYANPWPAGGGKNLFNLNLQNGSNAYMSWTVSDDGIVTVVVNTASANSTIDIGTFDAEAVVTYTLNGCPSGGSSATQRLYFRHSPASEYDIGNGVNFIRSENTTLTLALGAGTVGTFVFKPMVRLASETDSTFAPYSNICPISGWTGLSGERCGKNLFPNPNISGTVAGVTVVHNEDEQSYTISGTSTAYRGLIFPTSLVLKAGTYTVSRIASSEAVSQSNLRIEIRSMDGLTIYASSANSATFTLEEDTEVKPRIVIGASGVDFGSGITYRFQLELGSTATDYEPFQSNQISVTFPSEAGTVYGGTLDVTNGVLTVDRAMVENTATWRKASGSTSDVVRFFTDSVAGSIKRPPNNGTDMRLLCNIGVSAPANSGYNGSAKNAITVDTSGNVSYYPDSEEVKNTSSVNDYMHSYAEIVYELATPITYQLTASEISGILSTLYGTNNIWSDTGDTEVTYPADTKLYIDGKIAEAIAALNS